MKKIGIYLLIIFILAMSCTKSRFATTTRHSSNGKVFYTNHYSNDRIKLKRQKTPGPPTITQSKAMKNGEIQPGDNTIRKMEPLVFADKDLVAVYNIENAVSQFTAVFYPEIRRDIVFSMHKQDGNTFIKGIPRGDTATVKKKGNGEDNLTGTEKRDQRKTEKLGLAGFIISLIAIFIPFIGVLFAILAIIFGAASLKKIKRNPGKYKGKGFAIASIAIGSAIIVTYIAILVGNLISNPPAAPQVNTSATTCHV